MYLPHVCPWDPPRRAATQATKCTPSPPAQEHNGPFAYHCGDVCAAPATQATGLQPLNSMMLSKVGLAICLSLSARRSARLGRVRCCRSSLVGSVIPHVLCSCRNLINRAQVSAEGGFSAKVYADRLRLGGPVDCTTQLGGKGGARITPRQHILSTGTCNGLMNTADALPRAPLSHPPPYRTAQTAQRPTEETHQRIAYCHPDRPETKLRSQRGPIARIAQCTVAVRSGRALPASGSPQP